MRAQIRSLRILRMMRLDGVPRIASRPGRFMHAAESGHSTRPAASRAGTMRAITGRVW